MNKKTNLHNAIAAGLVKGRQCSVFGDLVQLASLRRTRPDFGTSLQTNHGVLDTPLPCV